MSIDWESSRVQKIRWKNNWKSVHFHFLVFDVSMWHFFFFFCVSEPLWLSFRQHTELLLSGDLLTLPSSRRRSSLTARQGGNGATRWCGRLFNFRWQWYWVPRCDWTARWSSDALDSLALSFSILLSRLSLCRWHLSPSAAMPELELEKNSRKGLAKTLLNCMKMHWWLWGTHREVFWTNKIVVLIVCKLDN